MRPQINTYTFEKESTGKWYIVLPGYPGNKAELEMVEGADIMLDHVGGGAQAVTLALSEEHFPGSTALTLLHDYTDQPGGGGIYHLKAYAGEELNQDLWLCEVTEYVFGKLPANIYFKKV